MNGMNTCPHCGEHLQEEAHFCPYCMTSLDEKTVITVQNHKKRRLLIASAGLLLLVLVALTVLVWPDSPPSAETNVTATTVGTSADTQAVGSSAQDTAASTGTESDRLPPSGTAADPVITGTSSSTTARKNGSSTSTTGKTATTTRKSESDTSTTGKTATATRRNESGTSTTGKTTTTTRGNESSTSTTDKAAVTTTSTQTQQASSTTTTTESGSTGSENTTDDVTTTTPQSVTYRYIAATTENCYPPEHIPVFGPTDAVVITGVSGIAADGIYEIPSVIDGHDVRAIMPSAFSEISAHVKTVVVPRSVRTVWSNAFAGCVHLTDLYVGAETIALYKDAFPPVEQRTGTLTLHCGRDCRNFDFYYYRSLAQQYGAQYAEWNGEAI